MNVQPAAPGARGFFPTIIRAWALILIVAIAFGLAALGYLWWRDPVYRATATLYVTSGSDPNPSSWDTVRGAKERAPTYASLAYTDAVIAPAVEAAGLNMPVDVARAAIQVEINSQITMMTVSATDADPLIAQRLAGGVADSLADAVATLEVPGGGGVPVARLTVVNTATVEENLFFPKPWITVLVASGVGLIVGLLLALILERLNNRARDERDAEVALDSRTLATIPAGGVTDGLVDFDSDNSDTASAFRALRTALAPATHESTARKLLVTGARAGQGTTTVAINLAAALARASNSVVLVDANLTNPAASIRTGADTDRGLADVLAGRALVDEALLPARNAKFAVLAAGSASADNSADLLSSRAFADVLDDLAGRFEYVIIDSASLLDGPDGAPSVSAADGVLLIVKRKSKLSDLRKVRASLAEMQAKLVGLVFCDFSAGKSSRSEPAETPPPARAQDNGQVEDHETLTDRRVRAHRA